MHIYFIKTIFLILILISGCTSSTPSHYAPVVEAVFVKLPPKGYYRVRQGDTMYAIAWSYNLDYRNLAQYNQLTYPYPIHPGQLLHLEATKTTITTTNKPALPKKVEVKKTIQNNLPKEPAYQAVNHWSWPITGKLIANFNPAQGNKGINIAGKSGSLIRACAAGEVVYCGSGLPAYGQMIIIKHNADYLSAYAHNKTLLVKEGQWIKSGQGIALMGNSGTDKTMLHFEIRKSGKPVNPLALLPRY